MTSASSLIRKLVPEVRFWACFAVVFALLGQALFPVQALAFTMDHGAAILCNDTTAQAVSDKASSTDKSGMMGLKCADCVLASVTAIQTPVPAIETVVYTIAYAELKPAAERAPVKARAPPRPHSCGPPSQTQA
ncbi:hypothetical protein ABAC460_12200 [Asticcacaulis sp. AC460]|uniref:hypothetical protein n=1 Tax=Asticcacaulis sp. AC460 TaxID=1282360 RepID=UPI0003C3E379|nr:hypothetical protein [Asticcacaulis sp. AC460]ESQ89624.1 hypothetical protein ABAC460_12200 [Asticcacaulis sp. AC460]